jgi:asparagine synthase (glutamine-hydrolysing)
MIDCSIHRGPDDSGCDSVAEESERHAVVFGHRRLAIVDLSAAGHQPMQDSESGHWITFNGEIYNFRELRQELEGRGHLFRSHSDTEVILKAYAEWGVGCWRRLRGIFAFGLWDARARELHLVRDHLGVKPLYYAQAEKGLIFASEVRAILGSGGIERRLSLEGLSSYLKYGSVQEPVTLIAGVESLTPGHFLTVETGGRSAVRAFWRVSECLERNNESAPTVKDVRAVLEDSVRRQMMADVPVGVFLSGGVDSTAIAALALNAQTGPVRTFCIGSDDPQVDESSEAARTAQILGSEHSNLVLEGGVVRQKLDVALSSYDQPSYDGINTYFVSMLVRQAGIKVAIWWGRIRMRFKVRLH